MNIFENSTVLLTGADGGIGTAFINELLSQKVSKIYLSGINLEKLTSLSLEFPDKLIPIYLDITNENDIITATQKCSDVSILINNAGIELKSEFIHQNAYKAAKLEMDINYLGMVHLTNSFIPILKKNSPSAIINILSIASLIMIENIATYCASKTASHIFTQQIRKDLQSDSIQVYGIYPGYVDTKMIEDFNVEKASPATLVNTICEEIKTGKMDIFPDKMSKKIATSKKLKLDYL